MDKLLDKIFKENNFSLLNDFDFGNFFYKNNNREFWLVVTPSDINLLELQPEWLEKCVEFANDRGCFKNSSLILLVEHKSEIDLSCLKKHIMEIEEDPYYFKKYVLYYTMEERNLLKNQLQDSSINDFIDRVCVDPMNFKSFKENPNNSWESLFFRMISKIPFLQIRIGATHELSRLFDQITESLKDDSVYELKEQILHSTYNFFDIKEKEMIDFLKEIDSDQYGATYN